MKVKWYKTTLYSSRKPQWWNRIRWMHAWVCWASGAWVRDWRVLRQSYIQEVRRSQHSLALYRCIGEPFHLRFFPLKAGFLFGGNVCNSHKLSAKCWVYAQVGDPPSDSWQPNRFQQLFVGSNRGDRKLINTNTRVLLYKGVYVNVYVRGHAYLDSLNHFRWTLKWPFALYYFRCNWNVWEILMPWCVYALKLV